MLPFELVSKVVEAIIGDIGKNLIARGQDPTRQFARKVFAYYESLKEYRSLCDKLLRLIEHERELVPSGQFTPGTARVVQETADRMAEIAGELLSTFESELALRIHQSRYTPEAQRSFRLVEVYDVQLARLIAAAHSQDNSVYSLAKEIARVWVNWETQEIATVEPSPEGVDAYIEGIGALFPRAGTNREDLQMSKHFTRLKFPDAGILVNALQRNLQVIDDTIERLADFMRANFKLSDLL